MNLITILHGLNRLARDLGILTIRNGINQLVGQHPGNAVRAILHTWLSFDVPNLKASLPNLQLVGLYTPLSIVQSSISTEQLHIQLKQELFSRHVQWAT